MKSIIEIWKTFNRITVLEEAKSNWRTRILWKCICWTIKEFNYSQIVSWHIKSCWCLQKEAAIRLCKTKASIINVWDRFNSLSIIEEIYWLKKRNFLCKCDCWNEKIIVLDNLRTWHTKTCWLCDWYKTTEKHRIRMSKEYNNWRTKCFERDNYTCQLSGKKWWRLVVHHLVPYHSLFNDINWEVEYSDLLFDISNWITISEEIHKQFHNQYWNVTFTAQDFYDFSHSLIWS